MRAYAPKKAYLWLTVRRAGGRREKHVNNNARRFKRLFKKQMRRYLKPKPDDF